MKLLNINLYVSFFSIFSYYLLESFRKRTFVQRSIGAFPSMHMPNIQAKCKRRVFSITYTSQVYYIDCFSFIGAHAECTKLVAFP